MIETDKTKYLSDVIFRALKDKHPPDVVADALLIAADQADSLRHSTRSEDAAKAVRRLGERERPTAP